MSVTTTADVHIEKAREAVDSAVKALGEVVVHRCEGTGDYTQTFLDRCHEALSTLIHVRDRLG